MPTLNWLTVEIKAKSKSSLGLEKRMKKEQNLAAYNTGCGLSKQSLKPD